MKSLVVLAAVALLAGCGGGTPKRAKPVQPRLPRALAADWRAQADAVAAALHGGDGCTAQAKAATLRVSVIRSERRIPPAFRETLTSAVNDLAERIACTPPPAPVEQARDHGDHGGHRGHGDHGDHGGHGDKGDGD